MTDTYSWYLNQDWSIVFWPLINFHGCVFNFQSKTSLFSLQSLNSKWYLRITLSLCPSVCQCFLLAQLLLNWWTETLHSRSIARTWGCAWKKKTLVWAISREIIIVQDKGGYPFVIWLTVLVMFVYKPKYIISIHVIHCMCFVIVDSELFVFNRLLLNMCLFAHNCVDIFIPFFFVFKFKG